jgi:hypothetical protein
MEPVQNGLDSQHFFHVTTIYTVLKTHCISLLASNIFTVPDGKGQGQPACQKEWKKCEEENESLM